MEEEPSYTVGQVAGFAGVTVRTLHHYDEIGLLSPRGRSAAGYRHYSKSDLERLQQVMFYRELAFSLDEIRAIVDQESTDATSHLQRQHALLLKKLGRLEAMVGAVEYAMEAKKLGIQLTPEEQFEIFGDHLGPEYAAEAENRWGHMPAYQESMKRAGELSKEEWIQVKAKSDHLDRRFVGAMQAGFPADSGEAMGLAEEHRLQIAELSGKVDPQIHVHITDLYVSDERYKTHYDKIAPGLGQYIRDAAHANARRMGA